MSKEPERVEEWVSPTKTEQETSNIKTNYDDLITVNGLKFLDGSVALELWLKPKLFDVLIEKKNQNCQIADLKLEKLGISLKIKKDVWNL